MSDPLKKLPRPSTPEQRRELKTMTNAALRTVNADAFALVTRVEAGALSKYGLPHHENAFMPIDVMLDLQLEFGRGMASPILESLAAMAGFKLVPIDGDDDGDGLELNDVTDMIKEGGEAKAAALGAVNTTCLQTVRTARQEIREARAAYAKAAIKLAHQERNLMARVG